MDNLKKVEQVAMELGRLQLTGMLDMLFALTGQRIYLHTVCNEMLFSFSSYENGDDILITEDFYKCRDYLLFVGKNFCKSLIENQK